MVKKPNLLSFVIVLGCPRPPLTFVLLYYVVVLKSDRAKTGHYEMGKALNSSSILRIVKLVLRWAKQECRCGALIRCFDLHAMQPSALGDTITEPTLTPQCVYGQLCGNTLVATDDAAEQKIAWFNLSGLLPEKMMS